MATIESYSTAARKRYRVRYRTPDRKQTDKRGFRTKRDAEQFANSVEVSMLRGEYVEPRLGRVTVGELGPGWLTRQRAHMKPSGWRSLESAWRVHVEPRWGVTPINSIRYSDVQGWIAEIAAGRSAALVQTVLPRILEDAVRDRMLANNPARGVKLPTKKRTPNRYLSDIQVHRLADEAGHYRALVLLLSYVGLRWGEAAGLRVADVDFLRRRILVHENAVQVGSEIVVGTLKGHKHRTVPLPRFVADELARTCEGKASDGLLWPARSGKHLGPPSAHDSWLAGAVSRCQKLDPEFPRVTAHDLRHTAASLAVSAGANVKAVQKMLGHASAAMTVDVYADLFDDDLAAVADRLDERVGKMWAETGQRPGRKTGTDR